MKEKDFEVLIAPTDVLGKEMKDVLGGSQATSESCTKCKRTHCNCDDKGKSVLADFDLIPGYVEFDRIYVELD